MSDSAVPESLRRAIASDLRPVQPLAPVWQRTLVVAAVAAAFLAVVVLVSEPRQDLETMPMWVGWGLSLIELLVGTVVVGLALREAVPGAGVPFGTSSIAVTAGVAVNAAVGVVTWVNTPATARGAYDTGIGMSCMAHDCVMGLPVFLVTLWLVFRALPMRAPVAGLLGGCAAGISADAIMHLLCPISALQHVLLWHTGSILVLMALGWAIGRGWERHRWRS